MSIQGFIVDLSSDAYETPNCCASCMGPRQTVVTARVSEKTGNVRTTLTLAFPYCEACAKRARREKIRQVIVGIAAAAVGAALALAAWFVDAGAGASVRFAVAVPLATLLAAVLALATRQSLPAPPATARGEAIILRNASGTALCTNPQFAQILAEVNGRTPRPGVQRMTLEVWAPLAAALFGVLVLLSWIQVGAPEGTDVAKTASPAARPAPQPAQPKKPAPTPPSTRNH
jgi:hypothetical protein